MSVKSKTVLKSDVDTDLASASNITAAEHRAIEKDVIDSYEDFIGSYTTAQIAAIVSPTLRQVVYDTTLNEYFYFDGSVWQQFSSKWKKGAGADSLMDKRSDSATGDNSTAMGTGAVSSGDRGKADGLFAENSGDDGQAIGGTANNEGDKGQALGYFAINRIDKSTNISGAIIIRNAQAGSDSEPYQFYSGAEVLILSPETDLKAAATQTITLPTGVKMYVDEVGIICTQYSSVNTQPTVSYGKTGSNAFLKAAAITTDITGVGSRERETTLLTAEGLTSLTGTVTIAATGTTLQGRFYFKGFIVEDQ